MTVNGEEKIIQYTISLKDYLLAENYNLAHIAVELNDEIIKKCNYENTMLDNSSRLEIVHFLGGG